MADDSDGSIAGEAEDLEQSGGVAVLEVPVSGTIDQLSLFAGGEEPESSVVVLRGGMMPVEGQFDKGDYVTLWVRVRFSEVDFVDTIGKDGGIVGTTRKHVAKITQVRRLDENA